MNIELNMGPGGKSRRSGDEPALNVLLVGNFRGSAGESTGGVTAPVVVDPVDIDAALRRIGPSIDIEVGDDSMCLEFRELDDFHPDHLLKSQPAFQTIAELRAALGDPARAENARQLCAELLGIESAPAAPADTAPAPQEQEGEDDLLQRLLGQPTTHGGAGNPAAKAAVARILDQVAETGDIGAQPGADVVSLQQQLDGWRTTALRELLRIPEFRALEANWRSLRWFGEQFDADTEVKLWLADLRPEEIASLGADLCRRAREAAGSIDLTVVFDTCDGSDESVARLQQYALTAEQLDSPVFAAATPALAGVDSTAGRMLDGSDVNTDETDAWLQLRAQPGARRIALAFPRILLRQPYGKRSDAIETFDFDELGVAPDHEAFFWVNPATIAACMYLLDELRIDDLPYVVFEDGSGQDIKPTAETYISDAASEVLLKRGIIPLLSIRGQTGVIAARLQSIASPPTSI